MPLLLASQPAYDLASLAKIQAAAATQVDNVREQYIQQQERQRKLNLDAQTNEARLRQQATLAAAEREQSNRRLDLQESIEARQREMTAARIAKLDRDAAVLQGIQQFRATGGGGSPGLATGGTGANPPLPSNEGDFVSPYGDGSGGGVLPAPPEGPNTTAPGGFATPAMQELERQMNEASTAVDAAIRAGDMQTARLRQSELSRLKGLYFSPSRLDPNKAAMDEARLKNLQTDTAYKQGTLDARVDAANANATIAGVKADIAQETQGVTVDKAKADAAAAEARVDQIKASTALMENPAITPGTEVRIKNDMGKLQSQLAADVANQVKRKRIIDTTLAKVPEDQRELMISSLETSKLIPKVMSDGERQEVVRRISSLQATLDGSNTAGSNTPAQEFKAPTQGDAAPSSGSDGQVETLDSLLGQ